MERDVALIDELVATHDVVYLALDSREARWLPTVMASKHGKVLFKMKMNFLINVKAQESGNERH